MSRSSMPARLAVLGLSLVLGVSAREAFAIKQFFDEFKEVYAKEGSPLAAEVETAKCNVCHKGKSKKDRNAYGEALAKLLDKKEDKANKEKIRQALETVAQESSDPATPDAPTFGALLAEGKLPGGPVE
jgi:cytochrome c2